MDTNTTATHVARTERIAQDWAANQDRLVTVSTGIVHQAIMGGRYTACGTKVAARAAAKGMTPTCRNCGADRIAE